MKKSYRHTLSKVIYFPPDAWFILLFLDPLSIIIMAAGNGGRMMSDIPKVMHKLSGVSMLQHLLETITSGGDGHDITVVVSEELRCFDDFQALCDLYPVNIVLQKQRLGTAHAVKCAIKNRKLNSKVLVLNGDVPFITYESIEAMLSIFDKNIDVVNLGFHAKDPTGYGRLITYDDETVIEIVESSDMHSDLHGTDKSLCNAGPMLINSSQLQSLIQMIDSDNSRGEYYITDIIKLANSNGISCGYTVVPEEEAVGINTKHQLIEAEHIFQMKTRKAAIDKGVFLMAPENTYIDMSVKFGRDVTVHPFVCIEGNTVIGDNVTILPFSHIKDAHVGNNSTIGPYSRLRAGAKTNEWVKIGSFVEVKNCNIGDHSKAAHMAYLGDADIGTSVNIGAGTVFCNYDGKEKHKSYVGDNAFIGANTSIISPVEIGNDAKVAASSAITDDIPAKTIGIARAKQLNKLINKGE